MLVSLRKLLSDQDVDFVGQKLLVGCTNHQSLFEAKQALVDLELYKKAAEVTFEVLGDGYYKYIEEGDHYIKVDHVGILGYIAEAESIAPEEMYELIQAYLGKEEFDIEGLMDDYLEGGIDKVSKKIAVYLGKKFNFSDDDSSSEDERDQVEEQEKNASLDTQLQNVSEMMKRAAMSANNGKASKRKHTQDLDDTKSKGNDWSR